MKQLFVIIFFLSSICIFSQTESKPMLLGKIAKEDMTKAPYGKWFYSGYETYFPNEVILNQLKKARLNNYRFTIFLGTWCGDSHREVPRFVKVLEKAGVLPKNIEYIALNTGDGVHKQSPEKQEVDKYIFKVPTIIISRNNKEVNRIVEYPVESLERDLQAILANKYSPNYRSYPYITDWLKKGLMTDENVSIKGLADQIRHITKNAGEITSAAYVLCEQGKKAEAAILCKMAIMLYPETVNYSSCVYMLSENNEYEEAMKIVKKLLARSSNEKDNDKILELYDNIKTKLK